MPAEVIDLISSDSPCPPSPPLNPVRVGITSSPPKRASSYESLHVDDILGTNDAFPAGTARVAVNPTRPTTKRDNDYLFLEEDFDTTGDLDGFDTASNRAPPTNNTNSRSSYSRASTWIAAKTTTTTTTKTGAKVETKGPMRSTTFGRWNSVAEPIDNSSDPFDLTKDDDLEISPWPNTTHMENLIVKGPSAASKPPRKGKEDVHNSSDPFADSSPARPKAASKAAVNLDLDIPSDLSFVSPVKSRKQDKTAWDPISSSMPEPHAKYGSSPEKSPDHRTLKRKAEILVLDDDDSDEVPELDAIDFSKLKSKGLGRSFSESPRKATKVQAQAPKKTTALTADQKEWEKRRKEKTREAEKERKRMKKEEAKKQREKEKMEKKALDEVNKLKTDKKASTSEMIVDLPQSFAPSISLQINKILEDFEVQWHTWHSHPVDHIVKWRRKVESRYNEDLGHWEPVPLRITPENHVLVVIEAPEFVKLALGTEGHDIDAHMLKMRMRFPNEKIIYLLEGIDIWMRKNRNARNRQFTNAVRGSGDDAAGPSRRRNAAAHEIVDEDTIEDALVALQCHPSILIHHTAVAVETAQWIGVFTQHISTIPYRKAKDLTAVSAGFCMESGQVRTGDTPTEIFVRMLQENARITAPMAYGIVNKYKSVSELVKGFEEEGPLALENCRKSANKDGALTDRTLGQAASRRLYKVFTGRDDNSTDI
ncbi:ERCC4 domain-containing protein [Apiospora kogelbergensis]|uniref:ERCC4 domain-containing protein n=1 Tax=Apiospora kogelbergensis TaxID=1337665 RepID=UPI003131CF7D